MENKKLKNIISIVGLLLVILIFVIILMNNSNTNTKIEKNNYEKQQLQLFTSTVEKEFQAIDVSDKSVDELQSLYTEVVTNNQKKFGGSSATSVDAFSLDLLNGINNGMIGSVTDLKNTITNLLDIDIPKFVTELVGSSSSSTKTTLTMRSNTVCESVADSKYCLEGGNSLSANVYITNPNSDKWAVLIHGYLMSGSLIYNSLGSMYEEQGYNIIAPDLRGFGNSGGSVAMGYLESLDVYDWIKDLNSNYNTRYGVNVAPNTIIVHGISLGGATTLQLATNPDIASKKGGSYTATLEELNVKGFVDDCGYTSMSGIVTGMLSMDAASGAITSLLDSLNISEFDFMAKVKDLMGKLNISGFEELTENSYTEFSKFKTKFNELYEKIKNITTDNNIYNGNDNFSNFGQFDWNTIVDKYGNWFDYPKNDFEQFKNNGYNDSENNWTNLFPGLNNSNIMPTNMNNGLINNSLSNSGNFLDGVVGTAIMELVGVGLTEENYDYYSNVFAGGRSFPANAKVVIIHGTADTTVPHSNADVVAANISPAKLVHKWDAAGKPHAFVVVGVSKAEYTNVIKDFTDCVNDNACVSIN